MQNEYGVRIKGKYQTSVIKYDSLELAYDGMKRARNKIAFSSADVDVVTRVGGSEWENLI